MSRRSRAPKREILPDPVHKSELLAKFINAIMLSGKKTLAEKIVYTSLDNALDKLKNVKREDEDEGGSGKGGSALKPASTPVEILEWALSSVRPMVEVKSRRVGGSTYQVPVEVSGPRGQALAMRWLIQAARKRSEHSMISQLTAEIVDACHHRGAAYKKRVDTHKMAEANKAFSHFRW
ncbi:MAG: 30S ribosomal protein S7 [Gammaproteobacteria bacterium]